MFFWFLGPNSFLLVQFSFAGTKKKPDFFSWLAVRRTTARERPRHRPPRAGPFPAARRTAGAGAGTATLRRRGRAAVDVPHIPVFRRFRGPCRYCRDPCCCSRRYRVGCAVLPLRPVDPCELLVCCVWLVVVLSARTVCDAREWCCPCRRCLARCPAAAGGWNLFGAPAEQYLSLVQRIERSAVERNDHSGYSTAPIL